MPDIARTHAVSSGGRIYSPAKLKEECGGNG